ncbi:MAG: hypothetical protein ABFD18_13735 [Syntrophomonas sp.]
MAVGAGGAILTSGHGITWSDSSTGTENLNGVAWGGAAAGLI